MLITILRLSAGKVGKRPTAKDMSAFSYFTLFYPISFEAVY